MQISAMRMIDRHFPILLLVIGFFVLVLSGIGIWTEMKSEWRPHQRTYQRLTEELAAPAGSEPIPTGIQQIMLPEINIYDRCTSCHVGIADPAVAGVGQPIAAHPGNLLDEHPPERFGCTVCHGGQGLATTWRDAAHEPIPFFHDPITPPEMLEARCGWCHQDRDVPGATLLTRGRKLLAEKSCYGCHEIPGYEHELPGGPGLDDMGSKLAPEWLNAWLENPTKTLPGARMPAFHLGKEERRALSAFLLADHDTAFEKAPSSLEGDSDRGRSLFGVSRCITCHTKDGKGGTIGPELGMVGSKVRFDWLYAFLRDPQAFHPTTPMLRYTFTPQEALDLATYLSEELVADDEYPKVPMVPFSQELLAQGKRFFVELGCAGCHSKAGTTLTRIGPSMVGYGDRLVANLEFGEHKIARNLADWTLAKLRDPGRIGQRARMPNPHLEQEDAAAITIALLSLSDRVLSKDYLVRGRPPQPFLPQGAAGSLWRKYRCVTCHQVKKYGGTLSQAPLDREGSEVQEGWLRDYLLTPYAIRVNQPERMPRFRMTPEEASVLAKYISLVLRDDSIPENPPGGPLTQSERAQGEMLYRRLACAGCHIRDDKGGYVGPPLDEIGRRLNAGWLYTFLREPVKWRPQTLQPKYHLSVEDARSLVAFLMGLPPATAATGLGTNGGTP